MTASLESDPLPYQTFVVPFHQLPPQSLKRPVIRGSEHAGDACIFEEDQETDQLKEGTAELEKRSEQLLGSNPFQAAVQSGDGISARVTGPVGISIDATGLFEDADVSLMIATVLLVLILLLLIYRSPILALIPLVAVGFAYMVTSPILGFMADQGWITVDSQSIAIMTVLLFGAGTDYCLFLISRFRQLLWHEPDKRKALYQAITSSSGAIAMSGFTVVLFSSRCCWLSTGHINVLPCLSVCRFSSCL